MPGVTPSQLPGGHQDEHVGDLEILVQVRFAFFGDHRPPHTGIIVAGLGSPEVRLEVEVIAVVAGL
jgi:enamine deaminase RidA (YjgF/YER057c/UK114 family)